MNNTGKTLESYIQFVYQQLLSLNDYKDTIVSTNVSIKGKSGATNEFDVFYQFKHINLDCKVAIECKDWKNPVTIKEARDFVGKINDIGMGNVFGMMISKNGFQDGCIKFANSNGIKLLTTEQLPTIANIISEIIKKAFLPNENILGEPFWTLMEIRDGEVTGTYYAIPNGNRPMIPLFYSRNMANKFLANSGKSNFCVRGISQYQLRGLIALKELGNPCFALFTLPCSKTNLQEYPCIIMEAEELKKEYLL